ncbi:DNA-binding response regulator [Myxococcota bacterium]|nr:DNA-binding response regulator [Myxococcota bacterium]
MGTSQLFAPDLDRGPVWVVEDDPFARTLLEEWLTQAGFHVVAHMRGAGLLSLTSIDASAICLDVALQDVSGLELLAHFGAIAPEASVIALLPETDLETAHAAMKKGAYDYVTKPLDRERLEYAVRRAVDRRGLVRTIVRLEQDRLRADAGAMADGDDCSCEVLNLRDLERMAIDKALKAAGGSVGRAAKLLGMGRATLYRRLAEQAAHGFSVKVSEH